jgi:hypothetical protein
MGWPNLLFCMPHMRGCRVAGKTGGTLRCGEVGALEEDTGQDRENVLLVKLEGEGPLGLSR